MACVAAIFFSLPILFPIRRAAALTDPCALDPNNLIANGAMAAANPWDSLAMNWDSFVLGGAPTFQHVDNEQIDPYGSQQIYSVDTFDVGIRQTVTNLTPGNYYWFRLGYSLAAKSYDGPNVRVNTIGRKVGVDPYGGTDPRSPSVIWGPDYFNGIAALNIPEMTMIFTAQSSQATIFLRAMATDGSGGENRVWFDAVCMERTNTPPPNPPPPAPAKLFLPMVMRDLSPPVVCVLQGIATINVGAHPKGVAADPASNRVYAALFDSSSVAVVDAGTNQKLTTWSTNSTGHANGVGVTSGRVFVALRDSASVAALDATTGAVIANRGVGSAPYAVGAANGKVWVANFSSGTASVMDATTTNVIATPIVGLNPSLVAATSDRAFVSYWDGGVAAIGSDGVRLHDFTATGGGSFGVAFNATTNRLYVSNRDSNMLFALDANTGTVVNSTTLAQTPYALAFNAATNHVFVVLADANQVDVRDGTTLNRAGLVATGAQGNDGGDGIAILNGRAYIANNADGTLTVIQDSCP
ncbi:MAG: YncE family protein [Chloroflexi bacterium]|nr:YncE family protein [Chloroflexota bacterium]